MRKPTKSLFLKKLFFAKGSLFGGEVSVRHVTSLRVISGFVMSARPKSFAQSCKNRINQRSIWVR
jgi:hypothetical protein